MTRLGASDDRAPETDASTESFGYVGDRVDPDADGRADLVIDRPGAPMHDVWPVVRSGRML